MRVSGPAVDTARVVTADRLGDRATAWDELVARAPLPSPFLRSWWLEGVEGRSSRYVLVVDADDRLLGGLALERRHLAGVDVLSAAGGGKLCPDHLDLVAAPGAERRVGTALVAWFGGPGSRLLDLDGVAEGARVLDLWPQASVTGTDVAPFERVGDEASYLAARSRNFRSNMRRAARRLAEDGVVVRAVGPEESARALDAFARLHGTRRDRRELLVVFPRLRRALERGIDAGEVALHVAELDGEVIAVAVAFVTGDRVCLYQSARSMSEEHDKVGHVLNLELFVEGIRSGCTEIDFLRGSEDYKASFVSDRRDLLRLTVAHGVRARLLRAAVSGVRRLRQTLRHAD